MTAPSVFQDAGPAHRMQGPDLLSRISKSGRHTDARLRKIFHNLRKILAFERKTVNITYLNLIFTDFNALFLCFMAFLAHFHAQSICLDIFPAH